MKRPEPLRAGRLRDRITIQRPDDSPDGAGGQERDGWIDVTDDLPAEIIALRGQEAMQASIQQGLQLWRVTIRNRAGVDSTMRIRWGDVRMNIVSAAPNERRDGLVMTAESGGAD